MSKGPRAVRVDGDVAFVPITQGYEAVIDAEDASEIGLHCWYAAIQRRTDGSVKSVYAARMASQNGRRVTVYMHRVLAPGGVETDHQDGDGLNNRKINLRTATHHENQYNQGVRVTSKSGVKGVSWHRGASKWIAQIRANGEPTRYLGLFDDLDTAKAVVEAKRKELHGAFARTA